MASKGASEPSATSSPPAGTGEPQLSPAAQELEKKASGPYLMDITRKLPMVPPRFMAAIEGWGYDSLGNQTGKVFIITGKVQFVVAIYTALFLLLLR
jgi:hypothetical protein